MSKIMVTRFVPYEIEIELDKELTESQYKIMRYIEDYKKENCVAPTLQNIGDKFGTTRQGVKRSLGFMEKKGYNYKDVKEYK